MCFPCFCFLLQVPAARSNSSPKISSILKNLTVINLKDAIKMLEWYRMRETSSKIIPFIQIPLYSHAIICD